MWMNNIMSVPKMTIVNWCSIYFVVMERVVGNLNVIPEVEMCDEHLNCKVLVHNIIFWTVGLL